MPKLLKMQTDNFAHRQNVFYTQDFPCHVHRMLRQLIQTHAHRLQSGLSRIFLTWLLAICLLFFFFSSSVERLVHIHIFSIFVWKLHFSSYIISSRSISTGWEYILARRVSFSIASFFFFLLLFLLLLLVFCVCC